MKIKINYYKERINKIILYYEQTLAEIKNKLKNKINDNNIENKINDNIHPDVKIENDFYVFNLYNSETKMPLNNMNIKSKKQKYNLKNIIFINNRCQKCDCKNLESIYKCVLCDNLFLCKNCHKNNNKNKIHEHIDFFEINYPNELIKQIKDNIKENKRFNNIINNYYELLRNIFFDENGNISLRSIQDCDTQNLKQICKDMKSFNIDPINYYSEYKIYIKNELMKNNSEEINLAIMAKETLFLKNLEDFSKTIIKK